jgi:alkylhydroperoxidase family enzyme
MCGVAVLNGAEYEFFHHAPPFKKAGGTEDQVQGLRLIGQASFPRNLFTQVENDAADLTFQMTRNIKVDSELMKRLQKELGSTDTVELVTVIAAYNMVSRFLIALDVNPEDHPPA